MKLYTAFLLALMFLFVPTFAKAQSGMINPAKVLRSPAILTTSDVLTTTSIPTDAKAVHLFIDFTKGSLDSATVSTVGQIDNVKTAGATSYYKTPGGALTLTATGRYHLRVPRDDIGTWRYSGINAIGVGTATGSSLGVKYKFEY